MRLHAGYLVLLFAAASASRLAAQRPPLVPLELPPAPATLTARYVDATQGHILRGSQAWLLCCLTPGGPRDTVKAISDTSGTFRFTGLRPGQYVLRGMSLGYRQRSDTIIIGTQPPPKLEFPMQVFPMCLGSCPPDPLLVAAARARRDEWGCDADSRRLEEFRDIWSRRLAEEGWRPPLRLKLTRKKIAIEMVPVIDPLLCRKAASYFDEEGTVASLDFVVFRFRDLLLVAPSDEPWVLLVFDRRFRFRTSLSVVME